MAGPRKDYKKIFISWSGDNSKEIAKALKNTLENEIFKDSGLECFVSDIDISSGDDWWNKIKTELKKCKLGIVCITKGNLRAPWIHFEAGAMVARGLKVIPLLINCKIRALADTPLSSRHMVNFYEKEQFNQMISTINTTLNLRPIPVQQLDLIAASGYEALLSKLSTTLSQLKNMKVFNENSNIYPQKITSVNLNTVYISAPMSSLGDQKEYEALRNFLIELKPILLSLGFTKVVCPIFNNPDFNNFDGNTKAIKENFVELKQVDTLIVIYPKTAPSSVLVEIGYGLALCKKTVIFHHGPLPYILKDAGINISHIDSREYENFNDIKHIIDSNGKQLFKLDEDD